VNWKIFPNWIHHSKTSTICMYHRSTCSFKIVNCSILRSWMKSSGANFLKRFLVYYATKHRLWSIHWELNHVQIVIIFLHISPTLNCSNTRLMIGNRDYNQMILERSTCILSTSLLFEACKTSVLLAHLSWKSDRLLSVCLDVRLSIRLTSVC
jgi:hypothetical protein